MPFSTCHNCGQPKSPPYSDFYCQDCMKLYTDAREKAVKAGGNPAEAGKAALTSRAFNSFSTRYDPRTPFTSYDATMGALSAEHSRREGA